MLRVLISLGFLYFNTTFVYAKTAEDYFRVGDYEYIHNQMIQAIYNYSQAIKINPQYAEAYNKRGMVYLDILDPNQAILDFTKAIHIDPHFYKAYVNLGSVYIFQKEYEKAFSVLKRAILMNPKDNIVYSDLGLIDLNQYNYKEAISYFSKSIDLNWMNPKAYNNRAYAYFGIKEFDKAWEDVEKAQELGYSVDPYFINQLKIASGKDSSFSMFENNLK